MYTCANPAILAETGSLPMSHDCSCTVLKYYYRICSSDPSSLTKIALEISQNLSTSGYSSWAHKAITKLQHLGYNPHLTSANLTAVLSRLCDQSTQKLQSDIDCHRGLTQSGGSKLRLYRLIKKDIRMTEPYLLSISNPKIRQAFTKFRLSDHKLLIESGRHCKPPTPVNDRLCTLCQLQAIEDEIHFLIDCNFYQNLRFPLMQLATNINPYFNYLCSIDKFIFLMCNPNLSIVNQTAYFIYKAMQLRFSHLSPPA